MMTRTSLPPGFRFHPTDVELVMFHLKRKVTGKKVTFEVISELNIYKYSPWDLPDKSRLGSKDLEWFFFCPKETKYANGARMNRATECGYWKSTGKDRQVSYDGRIVGMVKTLVFHTGHPPKGDRTDWVMHEYRMMDEKLADGGVVQDAYVLCKVFKKSGPGPKNGAQYGAPFNEDDYDDDGEICGESSVAQPPPELPFNNSVFHPGSTSSGPLCSSVIFPGSTSSGPLSDSAFIPGSTSSGPLSDPDPSKAMICADEVPPPISDNSENIISMLGMFIPDSPGLLCENVNNEVETFGHVKRNEGLACSDGNDIFSGLEDLNTSCAELCGGGSSLSGLQTTGLGLIPMLAGNDLFFELNDLEDPLCFTADDMGSQRSLTDAQWAACFQQNYCPVDSVGSVQLDSALYQSPLLPEESNGRVNEHAVQFQPSSANNSDDYVDDWNQHL
ncbi:NAC domain-containing protein 82-like [Rhododendron vialii]|uniref:NAC domain-containing protein 82-like n=1 Tax=Rhododendron vialii TaxID=182163 RepID=UPI00265DB581|nr:NAC domain-containing protein 82-like [Rhododendron vialii]XP_058227937.1 NAC domain-containing protein 82-like [Rhododendron vialii]